MKRFGDQDIENIRSFSFGSKKEKRPCLKVQKYIPNSMSSSTLLFGDQHFRPVRYIANNGKRKNLVVNIDGRRGYLHALVKGDYVPGFYLFYDFQRIDDSEYSRLIPSARYRILSKKEYKQFIAEIMGLAQITVVENRLLIGPLHRNHYSAVGGNSYYELTIEDSFSQGDRFFSIAAVFACVIYNTAQAPGGKANAPKTAEAYMVVRRHEVDLKGDFDTLFDDVEGLGQFGKYGSCVIKSTRISKVNSPNP